MGAPEHNAIVGRHAVAAALAERPEAATELLLATGDKAAALNKLAKAAQAVGLKVKRVPRSRLEELAQGSAHQGAALVLAAHAYADLDAIIAAARTAGDKALVVIADHIQDPHNLGAILRSAAGAGAQGVVIPKDRACPLTPAAAKAAAGAASFLPVARVTNLTRAAQELKEAGLWLLAAATRDAPPPWEHDLKRPLALVVGGEHKGVGTRLLGECDMQASLPLHRTVESLNASVAAGVLLFEIVRQRGR
ncbi:MAG: 23S rRNA (guanosine(2251)-2'-O)-methyltransferase RlmB [Desulfarculaceae bacterium]|nr:23S rRNA (guanosine(2251)-2'-O)-methyltransferase RlmB [Desulfarculaceae bacterium]MCF8072270.1 23S rRNA (guanosine(2251)-2'-O)-methyltransferase RlmB [Desulfarculaceae bacterium]MCF8100191.1 23S rRNA (guanosine(2251)-2'-O)-methyltransferase RlmB [Desulfarculaceae bacterium]MCF8117865.1 23S rRNA (guanosine(2251)-2'-O)-methyltransferase RlmB [Desulfarculaceae bacterium]